MAGRKRAYSDVSGSEAETIQRVKCLTEKAALKPVAKNLDPNDWPCFVLDDACVYHQDGKTMANMLHAELSGPFIVRGKLAVEKEDRKCLIHKKFEGQYVEVSNCQGFSIGYEPIVLWASGKAGWFEIHPSAEYEPMYNQMVKGIEQYFFVTLLFEEMMASSKKNYKSLGVDQIMLKYATSDGTGLVKAEVELQFKNHAEFLISQMGKPSGAGGINWKATTFYKWLIAESPDVIRRMKNKNSRSNHKATSEDREPGDVIVRDVVVSEAPKIKPVAQNPRPKPVKQSMRAASIPLLEADDNQLDDAELSSPTTIILQTLNKFQNERHDRLTLSKVGQALYLDYSIKKYLLGQEFIKVYAEPVSAALTDHWSDTPFYTTLQDHLEKGQPKSELYTEARKIKLRRRARKGDVSDVGNSKDASSHQPMREGMKKLSRETFSVQLKSTESPEPPPSTGKTLPPIFSGRRSGKEAGLRLVSSPAKRPHSPDISADEGDQPIRSRQRKRRRPSLEIEMGDPEDGSSPFDHAANDDDADDELDSKIDTLMGIIAEPLPTLEPTGPNGMWACKKEGCDFIVRSANEEEGKQKIQQHYIEHANLIARESLVLQEARPHLPVSHLLDKLRRIGEEARKSDEAARPAINGVIVPQPIKRQGMAI